MKRKVILISFSFLFSVLIACSSSNVSTNEKDEYLPITDYFPNEKMIKVFNGGFENSGTVYIIDRIEGNKVQEKRLCTGAAGIYIYKVSDKQIEIIYSEGEGYYENKDFFNELPNNDYIVLKTPLKEGNRNGEYELIDSNIEIITPSGKYAAIKLTKKMDNYESIMYYAKEIGLIKTVMKFNDGLEIVQELIKAEKLDIDGELSFEQSCELADKYLPTK